ncbi:hypothetical protein HDU98_010999 [Podochytrium sp. JEL0797]|nr:hypothetical protein HDU98_010999 [Podochytrium sp. JEL0797]
MPPKKASTALRKPAASKTTKVVKRSTGPSATATAAARKAAGETSPLASPPESPAVPTKRKYVRKAAPTKSLAEDASLGEAKAAAAVVEKPKTPRRKPGPKPKAKKAAAKSGAKKVSFSPAAKASTEKTPKDEESGFSCVVM